MNGIDASPLLYFCIFAIKYALLSTQFALLFLYIAYGNVYTQGRHILVNGQVLVNLP